MSWAAKEPAYLVTLLREVYGPDGLRELADAVVFAQPACGVFKNDVEPMLEKYIY